MSLAPKSAPAPAVDIEELKLMLADTMLLRGASPQVVEFIATQVGFKSYAKGEPIFVENEASDHVYFVKSGMVEITKLDTRLGQVNRIVTLGKNANFSELSILTRSGHTTSANAMEPTELLSLNRAAFFAMLERFPEMGRNVVIQLAQLNAQVTNANHFVDYFDHKQFEAHPIFPKLVPESLFDLHGVLPVRYLNNTLLVALLDPSASEFPRHFSGHASGFHLRVCAISDADFQTLKKQLMPIYRGLPIQESIRSFEDARRQAQAEANIPSWKAVIANSPFFGQLSEALASQLVPHIKPLAFRQGQPVFLPGSPSEHLYLIQSGSVDLTKSLKNGGTIKIATIGQFDCFSEISLIIGTPHTLQAMAAEKARIGVVGKAIFHRLLMVPAFASSVATVLAKRLQASNRSSGIKYYTGSKPTQLRELAKLIPHSVMEQHKLLILEQQETKLVVGLVNAQNEATFPILKRYLSRYRIEIQGIRAADFDAWFREIAHSEQNTRELSAVSAVGTAKRTLKSLSGDPGDVLMAILAESLRVRTSDIHFEPSDEGMTTRFRIDGHLHELFAKVPVESGRQIVNRIKIASSLNIAETRLPQDGQIKLSFADGRIFSGRVSTIPSLHGETIVIRIYKAGQAVIPLDLLAPDKPLIRMLKEILYKQEGVLLVIGPTGAGKTSTLYSMVSALNTVDTNVITVEDPIEIRIPGVTQIQVNDAIDLGYDRILRHLLRQDPDVIMIGEIRDAPSAQIAFEAALTGHFVLSTIHANNSLDVVTRLRELGGDQSTVFTGLSGVVSQRLLRRVCLHCRGFAKPSAAESETFKRVLGQVPPEIAVPRGCPACNHTGFHDRFAVFEGWKVTAELRETLASRAPPNEILKVLRRQGYRTMWERGMEMVASGLTTFAEADQFCPNLLLSGSEIPDVGTPQVAA